jgi:ElaB/YqjD/DUF883 family membrane-anchored ribosome-binding protein
MGEGAGQVTNGHDRTWASPEEEEPPRSEDIVEDIETTRGAMTETVQAIGDRLDPANIVADAKATVREATVGKVEDMAGNAGRMIEDAGYTAQHAGGSIVETIKRNPIPAAMAAIGIGWLATHTANGERRYEGTRFDASRSRAASYGSGWTQGRFDEQRGDGPRQALADVGETVGDRAGEVGDTLRQVPDEVRYRAEGLGQQAGRVLDETPFVAGAVAVAVGAVIGAMLPATEVEQRVLGPATEKAIDAAEQTATEKMAQIEETVSEPTGRSLS